MGENLTLTGCPTFSVIQKYVVIKTYRGLHKANASQYLTGACTTISTCYLEGQIIHILAMTIRVP